MNDAFPSFTFILTTRPFVNNEYTVSAECTLSAVGRDRRFLVAVPADLARLVTGD